MINIIDEEAIENEIRKNIWGFDDEEYGVLHYTCSECWSKFTYEDYLDAGEACVECGSELESPSEDMLYKWGY